MLMKLTSMRRDSAKWLARRFRTIVLIWTVLIIAMWGFRPEVPYLSEVMFAVWIVLMIIWFYLTRHFPGRRGRP